jgi:uncharacterized membrane protein
MVTSDRKAYLDWLRGVGVLVMIQGHVIDSWTSAADRNRDAYHWITFVGGIGGAPVFLFLAGVAVVLGAGTRIRRGRSEAEAAALARRRGWQILGLAFLFRLQSWFISGGPARTLLKVDILNIMGLSMVVAALFLGAGDRRLRAVLYAVAAFAIAMTTPILRSWEGLAVLPDPVEAYLRPPGAAATFTLFPWAGFLLAGGAVGAWLDTRAPDEERRVIVWLAVAGGMLALAGYGASFLPAIYAQTNFWTSSPTFFFVRVGILMMLVGAAYAWHMRRAGPNVGSMLGSPLRELGCASLFVYWIHVEIVYGVLSAPLHRRLELEWAYAAFLLFSLLMFALVRLKNSSAQKAIRYVILAMKARLSIWPVRSSRLSL